VELPPLRDLVPIDRVWARLDVVEERLRQVTTSEDPFLTDIAQHLLAGGKRYRPMLAQVAAEIGGGDGDHPIEAGGSGVDPPGRPLSRRCDRRGRQPPRTVSVNANGPTPSPSVATSPRQASVAAP
jgi:geranylgeranyl pyrophosphate synthase